jgi:hypothetical protein
MVRCEDRGERWWNGGPGPGQSASWADPLSALNVGSAGSKPAGVGCNLTAWMHPLAAFSQLACSHTFAGPALIVISPKCQNRIMDMPTMRLF